jgi:TolB protein
MLKRGSAFALVIIAAIFWGSLFTDQGRGQDDRLRIRVAKGRLHISMALPDFLTVGGGAGQTAREITETVRIDLGFAGYFDLAPASIYAEIGAHDETAIPWDKYAERGVETVALGKIRIAGGSIEAEIRLFDLLQKKMIFGKKIAGNADQSRFIAHRIAGHILYHLTGDWGIFEKNIIFSSTRDLGSDRRRSEVWVMDYDGYNQRRVTFSDSLNLFPSMGPGNSGIVYTRIVEGRNADIYRLLLSGGPAQIVAASDAVDMTPAVSPDSKKVAFASSRAGNMDIYIADIDGSNLQRLTDHWAIDSSPCWSPDGAKIAFSSSRTGTPQIYIMDADGSGERRITYEGNYNDGAVWSPDGTMIAYSARRPDNRSFDVRIHDLTTNDTYYVTNDAANDEDPSWSPDGRWLAFASNRDKSVYQIFIVGIDGRNMRRLTSLGENKHPSWSW